MNKRIRKVRKECKLNQTEFGARIGLKQRTIADIESGRNNLTERNFESICRVFNVNPDWLRYGVGEMFNPKKKNQYLDSLINEYGLNNEHKILIESILELPPEMWGGIIDWIKKCSAKLNDFSHENAEKNRNLELEEQMRKTQSESEKIEFRILGKTEDKPVCAENHIYASGAVKNKIRSK